MDPQQARDDLTIAHKLRTASQKPRLPGWQPPVYGVAVAAGVCAVGLASFTPRWRVAAAVIALLCLAGVGLLALTTRLRQGIRFVRGSTCAEGATFVCCGVVMFITALDAIPEMGWAFTGLGIVGGAVTWVAAHRQAYR